MAIQTMDLNAGEIADLVQCSIQNYKINGFRSLNEFQIDLNNGLNVLVGKNGSGKTNFIDFLDFVSNFFDYGASSAVAKAGGISRVFSQEMLRSRSPKIVAEISGLAELKSSPTLKIDPESRTLFRFTYHLEIRFIKKTSQIFVSNETITFKSLFWKDVIYGEERNMGSVRVSRRLDSETGKIDHSLNVSKRLLTSSTKNPLRYIRRLPVDQEGMKPRERRLYVLENLLNERLEEPDESLLSYGFFAPAMYAISETLTHNVTYNFLPSKVREEGDLSQAPEITSDGSGLSSVLYQMYSARQRRKEVQVYPTTFKPDMLDRLVEWTRYLLPELEDISASADLHTGKYICELQMKGADSGVKIPLKSASDGTLKWLAFAAHLITDDQYLSIEEPENFLHPEMQSFLISLIRERMEDKANVHVVLSTHSETLINQLSPREIVIFEYKDKKSLANRVKNSFNVEEEINKTGFGLGHYYASNSLS